jgi:hypothetical protein
VAAYPTPRGHGSLDRSERLTTVLTLLTEAELHTLLVLIQQELEVRAQANSRVEAPKDATLASSD